MPLEGVLWCPCKLTKCDAVFEVDVSTKLPSTVRSLAFLWSTPHVLVITGLIGFHTTLSPHLAASDDP